jgi:DNA-binding CsgD family transcriptional regulator
MRKGSGEVLSLLMEAKTIAFNAMELPSIIPALVPLLEYEWITGKQFIDQKSLDTTIRMIEEGGNIYENSEFAFWLSKARNQPLILKDFLEGYQLYNIKTAIKAAAYWQRLGCPYEQALALFEGSEPDKRKALAILDKLGAYAIFEKLKSLMRASGFTQIPKGIREKTRSNSAYLTERELDVLQLLKEGLANKEIAGRLFISPKTVDHHLSSIFFKLDVHSRSKAIQEALQMSFLK